MRLDTFRCSSTIILWGEEVHAHVDRGLGTHGQHQARATGPLPDYYLLGLVHEPHEKQSLSE